MQNRPLNNRHIAKNTLLLYFRMLFLMAVSLYTSRVILNALGVEDFGIYNVVGGVVAMFSMLSGSLSSAITRFITYELGKGNKENLKKIFSSAVTIQLGLAAIVILLAETAGLWFLNVKMVIPEDRMVAANWVFQFSILTFAINLVSVPYNASIIAHERMSAFAYISILEALGKLGTAYLIAISPIDRLVFYALLMCLVALIVRLAYGWYCKKHFKECTYRFIFDRELLKRMSGFAGWNFIGASSSVLRDQGGNVLINLFCGPATNAARAVASQVNTAINGFVVNFMTALNPQITKQYAAGNHDYMMNLIFRGARFSFYMLLLLSLPVLVNTHYILALWLKIVPEHTVLFVQLILIFSMSESISQPLITAVLATGKVRNYQIIVGGLQMANLPISYLFLRMGTFPEVVIVVAFLISQCCLTTRLLLLKNIIRLPIRKYINDVYLNVFAVTSVSSLIPFITTSLMKTSFLNFVFSCLLTITSVGITIYYIGCNNAERQFIRNKLYMLKNRFNNKKVA